MRPEDFERQLAFGRQAEEAALLVFARAGWTTNWRNYGKRRDLCVQHPLYGGETVEVKNEDRFSDGANVCIELHQNGGRESGLLTSEATICIHKFGEKCVVYRTQPMRNWLRKRLDSGMLCEKPFGKADNGNTGVLVPQMMLAAQDFAEWIDFADVANSRVLKQPVMVSGERWDGLS